jgi:hypothetical protein
MTPLATRLLTDTDWALSHAYGPAFDTPARLAELADDDPETRMHAVEHLWGAVLHQGTIYPVTPPAARVVAAMLADPRLTTPVSSVFGDDMYPPEPTRAALLAFLAEVATSAACGGTDAELETVECPPGTEERLRRLTAGEYEGEWSEEDVAVSEVLTARATLACRSLGPELLAAVEPWLDDVDPAVADAARFAATRLALLVHTHEVTARMVAGLAARASDRAAPTDRRASCVRALNELDADTAAFLDDPDPAVRVCAAISASAAGEARAVSEVLAALAALPASDHWLAQDNPFVEGWLRFTLVAVAVTRVTDFDQLLPAALAVAAVGTKYTVERDWGPLLAKAFPTPPDPSGALTDAQRAYLQALVANDRLWDPSNGNSTFYLRGLGLPTSREECGELARGLQPRQPG